MRNDSGSFRSKPRCCLTGGWADHVRLEIVRHGIAISAVEAGYVAAKPATSATRIVLPGMPNLHSHAFQRGMAGLAETRGPSRRQFLDLARGDVPLRSPITPDHVEAIAAQPYVEMLEAGFTAVGEFHYLHHDIDGRPYADIGTMAGPHRRRRRRDRHRADRCCRSSTRMPASAALPHEGQRRFINDRRLCRAARERSRIIEALPDAVVGIAPHSLRAVTPEELRGDHRVAARDGPIHIHIAEQVEGSRGLPRLVRPAAGRMAARPRGRRCALVPGPRHPHDRCRKRMRHAASGAVAGLCPITEANLGDGIFPARPFSQQGGRFGIGSDSNVLIDAAEELRLLEDGAGPSRGAEQKRKSGPAVGRNEAPPNRRRRRARPARWAAR